MNPEKEEKSLFGAFSTGLQMLLLAFNFPAPHLQLATKKGTPRYLKVIAVTLTVIGVAWMIVYISYMPVQG